MTTNSVRYLGKLYSANERRIRMLTEAEALMRRNAQEWKDAYTAERAVSDRLLEALKPFVALLQPHNDRNYAGSNSTPIFAINGEEITLGDLRKGRDIITEVEAMRKDKPE